ncbi:MAG: hypothetical protein A2Y92_05885, partial [Chloroflexi bacterium RBG_13_57_8]
MKIRLWLIMAIMLAAIVLAATGCGATTGPSTIVTSQQNTGVWVSGQGKVTAVPDVAILTLGVQVQESSVAQAQSEAAAAMNAVTKALGDKGVAGKDIQTQRFTIYPIMRWDESKLQEVLVGYRVENSITAKIRKVDDTGSVIDAVVTAGGNFTVINGLSFTIDDPTDLLGQARELAMKDARNKASQLASEGGVKLGAPLYINESGGFIPIIQVPIARPGIGTPPS